MQSLIFQSIALLVATFGLFAALGWLLAGKKRVARVKTTADWIADEPEKISKVVPMTRPQPVNYLDAAAEHFTSGLVVPVKPETPAPKPAPQPTDIADLTPRYYDMAAANVSAQRSEMAQRTEASLQHRVSSLAGMTPESVEAAVQQAGSGLEPVRLSAPQGMIDDLTIISGIDYASQSDLNALGIYHFWQIAGWTPEHVAWVSNRVRLSKRIARENWMSQAARLAKLS